MRLILAIFCLLAGTAFGLYHSAELKRREKLLAEIIQLLENMAVQIRYRALPLGELFSELKGGEFLKAVGANIIHPLNHREAWNAAVAEFPELVEERDILISIGNSLGSSDTAGQVAMLELNKELLRARLAEASEAATKKGAMYRSVGVLSGLGLAIIVV
jgi:stage III sporulation protein AB